MERFARTVGCFQVSLEAGTRPSWTATPVRKSIGEQNALKIATAAVICAAVGAISAVEPKLGLPLLALAALFAAQGLSSRMLLPLLVISTFVTRFRVDILGFNLLPEHFLVASLVLTLLVEGKAGALWRAATDRTAVAMAGFIGWLALVSMVRAPVPSQSLSIVGWLCFDWLILVAVLASVRSHAKLERLTSGSSGALAALAILIWLGFVFYGLELGIQDTFVAGSGSHAVYAVSWEANILGSTLALWAFVALSSRDEQVKSLARIGIPISILAIVVSGTRAAIVGLAIGVLTWLALDRHRGRGRSLRLISLTALVAVIVAVAVPQVAVPIEGTPGELFNFGSGNGALRLRAAETALDDLRSPNVLVGNGANAFGQTHTDPTQPGKPWYLSILPLALVYDAGLVGLAILVVALATVQPMQRPARAFGALAVYLSAATATSPFWLGTTWLLIALAVLTRPGLPARDQLAPH